MRQHIRTGVAFALLCSSIASAGTLILNPRFVNQLGAGCLLFLALPLLTGAFSGVVLGRQLWTLARAGSSEDPPRAYELLWASLSGFLVFFGTLPLLPPFLGIFYPSETVRYGGALLLAGLLAYLAAGVIRYVASRFRLWVWPLLAALPVAGILCGATQWGRGLVPGSRVLVLAFPGLSWNVAEDLIEKGEMPNLQKLRRSGAWGDIQAVRPLLTPAIWTTVATGKTSEEHGVTGFHVTARDVRCRRIWEIFEERGWSVGLFGWPLTWPPRPVDGFIVPAVSDEGTETHPRELRFIRELAMSEKTRRKRSWGRYCRFAFLGMRYGARLGTLIETGWELLGDVFRGDDLDAARLFSKRKLRAKLNSDFFVELRRRSPADFAAYYTNIVHVAQTYFWKYYEPSAFENISPEDVARYGDSVHDAYSIVDEILGKILADTTGDDLVIVVSDHGAEALSEASRRTLTLRIEPMLSRMRLKSSVEATNLGARTYLRMKPGHEGNQERIQRLFQTARLDRGAFRPFHARVDEWGNVVVTVDPEVADWLEDTILYQGGRSPAADLIRGVEFQESARMKETGALVMAGNGVRPGGTFEGASLLDLVPTLLVLTGLDLAADLPGDVIEHALEGSLLDRIPGVVATYERRELSPLLQN